jgi:sugar lactone lactonase YvrE
VEVTNTNNNVNGTKIVTSTSNVVSVTSIGEQTNVSTLPGLGEYSVDGVAVDSADNIYATYGDSIIKISGTTITTLAGVAGTDGYADGTGSAARFNNPQRLTVDGAGYVYVADKGNYRIRKISPAGVVTTFAGSGEVGYANGTGAAAKFDEPNDVVLDNAGNLYVADTYNHCIRKISPAGVVTTFAGNGIYGYVDGTGTAAQFAAPYGVALDNAGNMYVTDYHNYRIRKISPAGVVTTLAGSGEVGYADGTGAAVKFKPTTGIAVDSIGYVYVSDYGNNRIRKISPAGVVTTLVQLNRPTGVALDSAGNLYVGDWTNKTIHKLTAE